MSMFKFILVFVIGCACSLCFLSMRSGLAFGKTKDQEGGGMKESSKKIITANEFQLVDSAGKVRASLSATDEGVSLTMTGSQEKAHLKLMVDEAGMSFLKLYDASSTDPRVDISVDDKGTHLFLAGEGKQQSYLFLKKGGASGVVLIDREGQRRAQLMLSADGKPEVTIQPQSGGPKSL